MMTINKTFLGVVTIFLAAFVIPNANASTEQQWRQLDENNTVLLTLPHGKVVIELTPQFSPKHVKQFNQLVNKGFYDGTSFYRVIDGFVAQAGPKDGSDKDKSVPLLAMEGEWSTGEEWSYAQVQTQDLFAAETGFKDSFAIAYNPTKNSGDLSSKKGQAWLTHCPGTLAMARNNEADTASSHFYFVIGQAPRYLDRIMTIFGRVVYGMQHIQAIQRTSVIDGEVPINAKDHTSIISMQLMANVPKGEKLIIEVENTASTAFAERVVSRKERNNAFFYKKPPAVLDVCQIPIRSRLVKR
jgi:peptidylprolyl isomerase